MAKPGTKPQPTHLKMVRGNPGKRKLNDQEPQPDMEMPQPPPMLSAEALTQWEVVAPQLHQMGVLTMIDASALEMYCVAYGNWYAAQEKIKEFGPLVMARSGYLQQSPYMQIANKAFEQMRAMLPEFGMTPSSRSGLKTGETSNNKNPFASLRD